MDTRQKQSPPGGAGFAGSAGARGRLPAKDSASGPLALLLARLEGVRRCGKGYRCDCPVGHRSKGTLSLSEGDDGRVLLRCWAGCEPTAILHALGLTLADLFERRPSRDMTPAERRDLRQRAKESQWAAALSVLAFESQVILIAAGDVGAGRALDLEDWCRLQDAVFRVEDARAALAPAPPWRPEVRR